MGTQAAEVAVRITPKADTQQPQSPTALPSQKPEKNHPRGKKTSRLIEKKKKMLVVVYIDSTARLDCGEEFADLVSAYVHSDAASQAYF
jgi:hypothetical protein